MRQKSWSTSTRLNVLTFSVCAVLAIESHASFVIDTFGGVGLTSPWPMHVTDADPLAYGWDSGVPGVLGGNRDSYLSINFAPSPPPGSSATASIDTSAGLLTVDRTENTPVHLQLVYGGEGGLALDLTTQLGFQIDFGMLDVPVAGAFRVGVFVWDGSPNEQGSAWAWVDLALDNPSKVVVPRSSFRAPVNWDTIQLVVFDFVSIQGDGFTIEQIGTVVPAPAATVFLFAFGLAASYGRRRKRESV